MLSPVSAVAPVPVTMSCLTSVAGGAPAWRGIRGFCLRFVVGDGLIVVCSAGTAFLSSAFLGLVGTELSAPGVLFAASVLLESVLSSLLDPQPVAASARTARIKGVRRIAARG